MKKHIFFFCCFFFFFSIKGKAQVDTFLSLSGKILDVSKQLAEMRKMNKTLKTTLENIKKGQDFTDKVNSQMVKFGHLKKIKKTIEDIIEEADRGRKYISENKKWLSAHTIEQFETRIKYMLSSIKEIEELIELILKTNDIKMSDYERVKTIEEKIEKIEQKKEALKKQNENLADQVGFKKIKEKIGSIKVIINEGVPSIVVGKMNLIQVVSDFFAAKTYKDALMLSKFVAVMFIIIQFFLKYFNSRIDTIQRDLGISLSDLTKPLFYIFLIVFFPTFLNYLDRIITSFFQPLNEMTYDFSELIDQIDSGDSKGVKTTLESNFNDKKASEGWMFNALIKFLNFLIDALILSFDMCYYFSALIGRTFLLGLSNLLFPFLLAFAALDLFKDYVSKGFRMYFTVVLLLYVIHCSFGIGHEIYKTLMKAFDLDKSKVGSLVRTFGKLVWGFVAIKIKLSLCKQGTQFIYRVLN